MSSKALDTTVDLLNSVGHRFTKSKEGEHEVVKVLVQHGHVHLKFSDNGKHFFNADFILGKGAEEYQRNAPTTATSDLEVIMKMFDDAPVKNGEAFYAESPDGQYTAIGYLPNDSQYGIAFVCDAMDDSFLGLIGFQA